MNKGKYFKNSVEWSSEHVNFVGLPRPFAFTKVNKVDSKRLKLAARVPIPWQSMPGFKDQRTLYLNQENENMVYLKNLCPFCGIKFSDNDYVTRWKTCTFQSDDGQERVFVFSDIHPFHIECMNQGRVFCPYMRNLVDEDFENGTFIELRKKADEQKKIAEGLSHVQTF